MRLIEIDLRIEGLVRGEFAPLIGIEERPIDREIPIGFACPLETARLGKLLQISCEVSLTSQPLAKRLDTIG